MKSADCMSDRGARSTVYKDMTRRVGMVLLCAVAACGGGAKGGQTTTPSNKTAGSGDDQSMQNTPAPTDTGSGGTAGGAAAGGGAPMNPAMPDQNAGPPIVFPNQDPDPQQAKAQVDQHLNVARQALAAPTPDPETALREAREALKIDAASLDAAAYVAFAYYHKKQYDTAELVLDDVFKRPAAKENKNIYYVYGLVYDHTNRPDQAVLAFKKASELDPSFASALVDLGEHQLQNKQYAEAQSTYEKLTGQMGRNDAVTLTALGSAYRGHSGDYAAGSSDANQLIGQAEGAYKRAISANPNYGPAYYNLGLLYLDADPFPTGGGAMDTVQRLNTAKTYLDSYKNMPGVDIKLYDERIKDVTKQIKRAQKQQGKAKKGGTP